MKRFLAMTMASVMALASGVVVNADGVTGSGAVEYDNSTPVEYDKVTVPTMVADSTYAFTLDPTNQLSTYDSDNYDADKSVYFTAIKDRAKIERKEGSTVTLYTKGKEEVAKADWTASGNVTITDKTITAVGSSAAKLHVWVPSDDDDDDYTSGKPGEFVELTTENIGNWFEVDSDGTTLKLKSNSKFAEAGKAPCDGKIYKDKYTPVPGNTIVDSDLEPITKYLNGTTIKDLYITNNGTDTLAVNGTDVVYTEAKNGNSDTTNTATVINKSTKTKTVTATVTMNNVGGLKFKSANSFTDDNDASLYVAAGGVALTKATDDADTATATYTTDLGPATGASEVTYVAQGTNAATGGHNYERYAGPTPTYTSNSFSITAAANTNSGAATAWTDWAKTITAETKPTINVVYTVADKVTAPASVAPIFGTDGKLAYTGGQDATIGFTAGSGDKAFKAFKTVTISFNGGTAFKLIDNGTPNARYATVNGGEITILGAMTSYLDDDTDITIVYTNDGDEDKTVTVRAEKQ